MSRQLEKRLFQVSAQGIIQLWRSYKEPQVLSEAIVRPCYGAKATTLNGALLPFFFNPRNCHVACIKGKSPKCFCRHKCQIRAMEEYHARHFSGRSVKPEDWCDFTYLDALRSTFDDINAVTDIPRWVYHKNMWPCYAAPEVSRKRPIHVEE